MEPSLIIEFAPIWPAQAEFIDNSGGIGAHEDTCAGQVPDLRAMLINAPNILPICFRIRESTPPLDNSGGEHAHRCLFYTWLLHAAVQRNICVAGLRVDLCTRHTGMHARRI
jgi:hypothetical protein